MKIISWKNNSTYLSLDQCIDTCNNDRRCYAYRWYHDWACKKCKPGPRCSVCLTKRYASGSCTLYNSYIKDVQMQAQPYGTGYIGVQRTGGFCW